MAKYVLYVNVDDIPSGAIDETVSSYTKIMEESDFFSPLDSVLVLHRKQLPTELVVIEP